MSTTPLDAAGGTTLMLLPSVVELPHGTITPVLLSAKTALSLVATETIPVSKEEDGLAMDADAPQPTGTLSKRTAYVLCPPADIRRGTGVDGVLWSDCATLIPNDASTKVTVKTIQSVRV